MNKTIKKCLIISSGGDAPGMNAAIRSVVRTAISYGISIDGSIGGFQGLIENQIVSLNARSVGNIIQTGGTILKTARCQAFYDQKKRQKAMNFIRKQGYDAVVILGGNGSFIGARKLVEESNIATIGIPCTIDNDIVGTEYTIGFDTACNTALKAIDHIRDTAFSHDRNFIIEVMGRSSGFLAVEVGIGGGAEFILIPEFPISVSALTERIRHQNCDKAASIIVAAEGDQPGHCFQLADKIKEKTGIEYKVCILGHTQRGGSPSARDRSVASLMGSKSIEALIYGETEKIVALNRNTITLNPFPSESNATRFFSNKKLLEINHTLCDA